MVARQKPSWVVVSGRRQIRAFSLCFRHIDFRRAHRKKAGVRSQRVRKQEATGDASSYGKTIDTSYKYALPQPVHVIVQLHLGRLLVRVCYLCRDSLAHRTPNPSVPRYSDCTCSVPSDVDTRCSQHRRHRRIYCSAWSRHANFITLQGCLTTVHTTGLSVNLSIRRRENLQ